METDSHKRIRTAVTLLIASGCVLLPPSLCRAQNGATSDARGIIEKSLAAEDKSDRLAVNYTFRAKNVIREFDGKGDVKSTKTTGEEIVYLGGKRYVHLLTRDGKPLTGSEAAKEQKKFDQAVAEAAKLSDAQKSQRLEHEIEQRRKSLEERRLIPLAYELKIAREEELNGRPAWVIHATPRKEYNGKHKEIFRNLEGDIWVDKADFRMAKVKAKALDNFSLGLILARVGKDSELLFELARINDEVWLPKYVSVRADARVALFKKFNVGQEIFFTDYKRYSSDSRIVSASEQ